MSPKSADAMSPKSADAMSPKSADAAFPAEIKKHLATALPQFKSSHLSEGLAAGCGYATHAAYRTDIRDAGVGRLIDMRSMDCHAIGNRLAELTGADPDQVQGDVLRTVDHLSDLFPQSIIPLGQSSRLRTKSETSVPAIDDDAMVSVLVSSIPLGTMWRDRVALLIEALVPACRSLVGSDAYVSDLMEATSLQILRFLADNDRIPERQRHSLRFYLQSVGAYYPAASSQDPTALEQHSYIVNGAVAAMSEVALNGPRIAGWTAWRLHARLFQHGTSATKIDNAGRNKLAEAIKESMKVLELDIRSLERAHFLVEALLDLAAERYPDGYLRAFDLRITSTLASLVKEANHRSSRAASKITSYLFGLPGYTSSTVSQDGIVAAAHAPVERAISFALTRPTVVRFFA